MYTLSKYQNRPVQVNMGKAKGVVLGIIVLIIIGVLVGSAVSIVDAGFRGVLLHWNAVDLAAPPLEEGLHFIVPFQDSVIPLEVRTLKYTKSTTSASQDLQTVSTEITVNYHPEPNSVHYLYKEVGLDYENRIIQPTVEEVVKQVTANYNAFSILFAQAIEAKVEAEQRALQAENDLKRIEVEARQFEAQAIGIAQANIAEAAGEAEAINIINQALANNPFYLEWLKTQQWDGVLPLVVGEGGTPFIQIPTQP